MIRRKTSLTVFLVVVAAFSLMSGCSSKGGGTPPGIGPAERLACDDCGTSCDHLRVYPTNATGNVISIPAKGVACAHGYGGSASPSMSNVKYVNVRQSNSYGPDCNITFNANNQIYVVRVQQNYCSLKAGSITASVVSGNATITKKQTGSQWHGRPGKLYVKLN